MNKLALIPLTMIAVGIFASGPKPARPVLIWKEIVGYPCQTYSLYADHKDVGYVQRCTEESDWVRMGIGDVDGYDDLDIAKKEAEKAYLKSIEAKPDDPCAGKEGRVRQAEFRSNR